MSPDPCEDGATEQPGHIAPCRLPTPRPCTAERRGGEELNREQKAEAIAEKARLDKAKAKAGGEVEKVNPRAVIRTRGPAPAQ